MPSKSGTRLAVPISGTDWASVQARARAAVAAGADILEWRADYVSGLTPEDVAPAVNRLMDLCGDRVPLIVTCRDPAEGGQNSYDRDQRTAILCGAVAAGADLIDCELENYRAAEVRQAIQTALTHRPNARLILSSHDFSGPMSDLKGRYGETVAACDTAIPKLVYTAHHINDCFAAFDLLHEADRDTVVLAMGAAGVVTRILAKKLGAFMTFVSLDAESETAPGQLSIDACRRCYRLSQIDADTEILGVVGDPIGHSLSPLIHNACLTHHETNRVYLPWWVAGGRDAFFGFCDGLRARLQGGIDR